MNLFDGAMPPPSTPERIPNPSYAVERLREEIVEAQREMIAKKERQQQSGDPVWAIYNETPTSQQWDDWKQEKQQEIEALASRPYPEKLWNHTQNLLKRFPGVDDQWTGADIDPEDVEARQRAQFKQSLRQEVDQIIRGQFDIVLVTALMQKADASNTTNRDIFKSLSEHEITQWVTMMEIVYTQLRKRGYTHEELSK